MTTKEDFVRMYKASGGDSETGERLWAKGAKEKAALELYGALVEAAEQLEHCLGDSNKTVERARAAIAKADGQ